MARLKWVAFRLSPSKESWRVLDVQCVLGAVWRSSVLDINPSLIIPSSWWNLRGGSDDVCLEALQSESVLHILNQESCKTSWAFFHCNHSSLTWLGSLLLLGMLIFHLSLTSEMFAALKGGNMIFSSFKTIGPVSGHFRQRVAPVFPGPERILQK